MERKNACVVAGILEYIRDQIRSGAWTAGQRLPAETALAGELGVSRASVRSAYQHLAGLGALVSRQGSGTFLVDCQVDGWEQTEPRITSEDCQNIRQVLEFRRILEPEACRMAARLGTAELVEELEWRLASMTRWVGTPVRAVPEGIAFHEAIARASGNPLLEKSLHKIFLEARRSHEQISLLSDGEAGIRFHTGILEAIQARDGQAAYDWMREHLESTLREIRRRIPWTDGDWAPEQQ